MTNYVLIVRALESEIKLARLRVLDSVAQNGGDIEQIREALAEYDAIATELEAHRVLAKMPGMR